VKAKQGNGCSGMSGTKDALRWTIAVKATAVRAEEGTKLGAVSVQRWRKDSDWEELPE
jgi:hypothetical protein